SATAHGSLGAGVVGADLVTLVVANAAFDDKNVGMTKTVTASLSLIGTDAANYTVNTTAATTANITAKGVTGSFTAQSKHYDGNTSAPLLTRSLTGAVTGDSVALDGGTATFNDKAVANGKTVTLAGATLTGSDAGNYVLDSVATTSANITVLHVIGSFTASGKTYDGTTTATVVTTSPGSIIAGDGVTLNGGTATRSEENVGTGKTVTLTGATLVGPDMGNYSLDSVSTTTADITGLHISGSFTASSKPYDGNVSATVLTRSVSGIIGSDSVMLAGGTATFNNKTVANGKIVT